MRARGIKSSMISNTMKQEVTERGFHKKEHKKIGPPIFGSKPGPESCLGYLRWIPNFCSRQNGLLR